jgi:hypothetical protein
MVKRTLKGQHNQLRSLRTHATDRAESRVILGENRIMDSTGSHVPKNSESHLRSHAVNATEKPKQPQFLAGFKAEDGDMVIPHDHGSVKVKFLSNGKAQCAAIWHRDEVTDSLHFDHHFGTGNISNDATKRCNHSLSLGRFAFASAARHACCAGVRLFSPDPEARRDSSPGFGNGQRQSIGSVGGLWNFIQSQNGLHQRSHLAFGRTAVPSDGCLDLAGVLNETGIERACARAKQPR